MRRRNEELHNDPWDRDFYETGSTQPPKNHGGAIAVLLILVILLCGIATFLGVMNIRLFHMLESLRQTQTEQIVQVQQPENQDPPQQETQISTQGQDERQVRLGIRGVTVSDFDRRFYELPDGCLVMEVITESAAEKAGIRNGDVIVKMNGHNVASVEDLAGLLDAFSGGESAEVTVYRSQNNEYVAITVTLEKGE